MDGISINLLIAQILNIALLIAWISLALWALFRLRREKLQDVAQVIWVAIILLVPVFGAVAFFIVRSRCRKPSQEQGWPAHNLPMATTSERQVALHEGPAKYDLQTDSTGDEEQGG